MLKLQDLAHQLNLSTGTVSRALARNPLVNAATAQRVQALAEQLGYQPNQLAANLRKRQSRTIGVLVPYLRDNFFTRVVHGIEATATALGYQVLICQSGDSAEGERQALARLRQAGVTGMLVSVAGSAGEQANWGAESSLAVPVVFFDRHPNQGPPASAALIDDRLGGLLATRHLLAQGYQRVAHLTGPAHLPIYRQRRLGYEEALREAGRPLHPELVVASNLREADSQVIMRQLLALPNPPDAVFAAGDFAALGCLRELLAQGRRVPDEVGVVGFSNEFFTEVTVPSLSTIDQHCEQLGQTAARLLLEVCSGGVSVPQHVVLRPQLLARGSSTRWPG